MLSDVLFSDVRDIYTHQKMVIKQQQQTKRQSTGPKLKEEETEQKKIADT